MRPPVDSSKKRTIVRFSVLALATIASACSGLPQRRDASASCPPVSARICEDFGPESRCRCADARSLDRELGRLGLTARINDLHW